MNASSRRLSFRQSQESTARSPMAPRWHPVEALRHRDYFVRDRHFGLFERDFLVPTGVDWNKLVASLRKDVLKVTPPKTSEALKAGKKIKVKAS
ncbi:MULTISPECIES: Hsp20/alpha crystallin family protein [Burkholderia]|uniref:Hsp20 family protein n=1 Tax=Burkholderia TaxID=32008 RepID=UPI001F3128E7|nr:MULTISPECIES: Hsp20/alpha crystallin family protein [Burkholderia]